MLLKCFFKKSEYLEMPFGHFERKWNFMFLKTMPRILLSLLLGLSCGGVVREGPLSQTVNEYCLILVLNKVNGVK